MAGRLSRWIGQASDPELRRAALGGLAISLLLCGVLIWNGHLAVRLISVFPVIVCLAGAVSPATLRASAIARGLAIACLALGIGFLILYGLASAFFVT